MTKMSFAQRIDVWRTLTARPADLAEEVPGLAELRVELAAILEEVQKTRKTCRHLRTQALVEAKRLEQAITRGEEAEQRLRRFLQASYGPPSQQLHRFGLKPRRGRRPDGCTAGRNRGAAGRRKSVASSTRPVPSPARLVAPQLSNCAILL